MNHHHFELLTCYDDKEKGIVVQACTKVQCTTSSGIVPVPGATTTIFLENNMFCYGIYVIVELHTVEVWMKCTKSEKSMFFMAVLFVRLK